MIQSIVEYKDSALVPNLKTQNYTTLIRLNYSPLLNYIKENIGEYTDEVVLTGANTEEDIDAIIELLKLNVDSKCRHVQIICNQNFCLDDIMNCCSDIWDERKEYVKKIWDTIINNNKLKPTWHNFYNYWCYQGHTDISINYISENVNALVEDDSSCIEDDSFIKELIHSNINSVCLEKLLPKLPWKSFDISLKELEKDKVRVIISQKYIEFNTDRYNEISATYPDLCVEFILYNQNEYMDLYDELQMDQILFETLLFDQRFNRANAQKLINECCSDYMTNKIAYNLDLLKVEINIDIFNTVWNYLDTSHKRNLMMLNLHLLNADMFESCFNDIGGEYSKLANRSRRHEVNLTYNQENINLVERLKEIDYITSFKLNHHTKYDPVKSTDNLADIITVRIKAVV